MPKRALVFPGQASQEVGMASDIHEAHSSVRELYDTANEILGYDIAKLSFEGPLEALTETKVTQPAIFIASAAFQSLLPGSINYAMTAGHSLGEFTALFAAGVLSFEDALSIVKVRAEGMQQAGEDQPGSMAALLNLSRQDVEKICKHASARGIVQAANFNSPGQIVISGEVEAVHYAMEVAKNMGARKAVELQVSGAFHSPLMSSAKDGLEAAVDAATFNKASVPVYSNCTGKPHSEPDELKANIIAQLENPVLWEDSVQNMISDGCDSFMELGPGRVLQGLIRRINRDTDVSGIQSEEGLKLLA